MVRLLHYHLLIKLLYVPFWLSFVSISGWTEQSQRALLSQPTLLTFPIHPRGFTMSVLLDGLQVPNVSFSPYSRSVLFAQFRNLLPSNASTSSLLVTTLASGHNTISFPLAFQTVEHSPFDVVFGLDWASYLRDSLRVSSRQHLRCFVFCIWSCAPHLV
jgi:hypothetical protein